MNRPNFFVIGAGRSGTTSLYHYLKQHPDVFMSPIKETNFFAYEGETERSHFMGLETKYQFPVVTMADYLALFNGASGRKAIGEVSPLYLHSRYAAEGIKKFSPRAKLIAILRHPVERAHSSFQLLLREGRENRTFAEAVRQEQGGIEAASTTFAQRHYLRFGLYSHYLSTYLHLFDRRQIVVCLFDDLAAGPKTLMSRLFRFLEVDATFVPDVSVRHNAAGTPTNVFWRLALTKNPLSRILGRLTPACVRHRALAIQDAARSRHLVKPELSDGLRCNLNQFYRDDILQLQDLLQRDLSLWLQ